MKCGLRAAAAGCGPGAATSRPPLLPFVALLLLLTVTTLAQDTNDEDEYYLDNFPAADAARQAGMRAAPIQVISNPQIIPRNMQPPGVRRFERFDV